MADITAIFGSLLFLGLTYPGLLTTWWLLFPNPVERANACMQRTPWKSFFLGAFLALFTLLPALFFISRPSGVVKLLGFSLLALLLAFGSLGAAGLAAGLGQRMQSRRIGNPSALSGFLQGALALELASFFPLIGWFLFFPVASLCTLGAAALALLRWMPASPPTVSPAPVAEATSEPRAA